MAEKNAIPQSPAEAAMEMARLRKEIDELRAQKDPEYSPNPGAATEAFAGKREDDILDDKGEPVKDADGKTKTKFVNTWFYKIDLPPSGGQSVSINTFHFYHGQTYRFTDNTLATVKEVVARSWKHENSIKGTNENFYRREQAPSIGARA